MDSSHVCRGQTSQGSAAEDLWGTQCGCNAQASWSTEVSGFEGGHQPPADSRDLGALEGNWPRLADADGGRSEGVGVSAIQLPLGADASRCSSGTLGVSVVETQLSNHQCITLYAIHHAMLICNTA